MLVKVLTEDAAFQFAKENGIDLVSTITPTVAGPFLTPTVPLSIQVLLSPITGSFLSLFLFFILEQQNAIFITCGSGCICPGA